MDVRARPEPAGDFPGRILRGHRTDEMPAIGSVSMIQKPDFHFERSAFAERGLPALARGLRVVGLQDVFPGVIAHGLRHAGEFGPAAVEVIDVAIGRGSPDDLRHGIGKVGELLLALPFLTDVTKDQYAADDVALGIANGCGTIVDGSFDAVPGDEQGVIAHANDLALVKGPQSRIRHGLPRSLMDRVEDVLEALLSGVFGAPAQEILGGRVDEGDPTLVVGADNSVADAGQSDVQALALLLNEAGVLLGDAAGGGLFDGATPVFLGALGLRRVGGGFGKATALQ